jgi:hypothetical protein
MIRGIFFVVFHFLCFRTAFALQWHHRRSDFALELAECSGYASEWAAHALDFALKMDNGTALVHDRGTNHYYIDHTNLAAKRFFNKVVFNVSLAMLPNGKPVWDYVYIDGDPGVHQKFPGISPARSAKVDAGYYSTFGELQLMLDDAGRGQQVILNGLDDASSAASHQATGAAGSMFDHFTILQFLNQSNGNFNALAMDAAFDLATGPLTANVTLKVKGWPGPIVQQRDVYPPTMKSPQTAAEFQQIAGDRFNSELALFLLVASERDFWVYSWFWNWYDFVPGNTKSTCPVGFYPEAKCLLGAPLGTFKRGPADTYTREFEHAAVFVDLANRTASKVSFATKCHH